MTFWPTGFFFARTVIVPYQATQQDDLASLSVTELKKRCEAAGLPSGGRKKASLIKRLQAAYTAANHVAT